MNETLALAKFTSELDYDKLPEEVQVMAHRLLFDFIGNSSYATKTEVAKIITRFAEKNSAKGDCLIFPDFEGKYDASFAALANGVLGHGFELDDVYMGTCLHPNGPVVGAALAMAQECKVSGKRLLEAIIAGYEVAIRVGLPLGSSHQDWGYHATASFTVFGAAAAAAKVLGLDTEKTAWAFGLCGSYASGLKQFSKSAYPSLVETLHAGKAAQQGVQCAKLAAEGFSGPQDVLEGPVFGYLKVYRGKCSPEEVKYDEVTKDLGKVFRCIDISIKPSCNCATTLTTCECIEEFKKDPDFIPENIEKVIIRSHHNIIQGHMDYHPNSVGAALYSTPFSVAFNILYDANDPEIFLDEKLNENKEILDFAQKITAELDEEVDALFPAHFGNKIEVYMKNGKVFKGFKVDYRGSAENPFTYEEVIGKFRNLVTKVYSEKSAAKLEENLRNTASFENVNEIFAGL